MPEYGYAYRYDDSGTDEETEAGVGHREVQDDLGGRGPIKLNPEYPTLS